MAKRIKIEFTKTYASEANALKAVEKAFGLELDGLRFDIMPVVVDGKIRYGVLFFGMNAMDAGVHFHFNVVA
jgi:hypothetical protein